MHAAAEDFMDVAHGEGDMVQAALRFRQLQQEQVVVATVRRAAQERAAVRVAVRRHEAELLHIELLGGLDVFHEEHHVADFDRRGVIVDRAALVHARLVVPRVHQRAVDLHVMLARDLEAHGQAVRVGAADAQRGAFALLHEARRIGDRVSQMVERCLRFDTPHHFAQRRAGLDRWRQRRIVDAAHQHAAAVQRFEIQALRVIALDGQAPVREKAAAGVKVIRAVDDLVDSQYLDHCFSPACRVQWLAHGSGCSFRPQYTLFCSMYCRMPSRPFSRPRPLSRQPPNGVAIENCL
ncbi:hypothetical protein D3C81_1313130 [compost metagenome]